MYFIASKVLAFIADPFTWFLVLFAVGLFRFLKYRKGKRSLFSSLVLILLLTNPFLSNLAIRYWEPDTYSADSISKPYDVGILLSGATRGLDQSAQRPLYGPGVDRVLQTIELYQKGKIKKIILTGSLMIEEEGRYYNRLIWMLPNGQYGYYDKRHLFAFAGEDQSIEKLAERA